MCEIISLAARRCPRLEGSHRESSAARILKNINRECQPANAGSSILAHYLVGSEQRIETSKINNHLRSFRKQQFEKIIINSAENE